MILFNSVFLAFLKEAQFTRELLAIGVTQLYKANYADKGLYYLAFTCLSTGLERIAKICLILDYFINNNGALPNENYVRKQGHKINSLFKICSHIVEYHDISLNFLTTLDGEIHQSIFQVLTDFAHSSGRYSDIDILTGKRRDSNCMQKWYQTIDLALYEKCIALKKRLVIEERAKTIGTALAQFASFYYIDEDNNFLDDPVEASKRTEIWKAVAPHRQLYMLQIIRYFSEIIINLGDRARKIRPEDIPYFSEIFAGFYNDDTYFKSRKMWDNF
jgi:hypothetical protein